jgi:hypothetical protein
VPWPEPRFTTNADTTITDNLTGLVWVPDGNIMPARDPGWDTDGTANDGAVTWHHALDYVAKLNAEHYLGHNDWRLPNINELLSLFNADEANLADWLSSEGFTNIQQKDSQEGFYWSSTTLAYYVEAAGQVSMSFGGEMGASQKEDSIHFVWPVCNGKGIVAPAPIWETGQTISYAPGDDGDIQAGVDWPGQRFTDHGNGTVTDNLTGLMWTQDANAPGPTECSPGTYKTWQQALDYVSCLNNNHFLGYTDWRLPNRTELHSLTDFSQNDPALPAGHPFINVQYSIQYSSYWSSTVYTQITELGWTVIIWSGGISLDYRADNFFDSNYVLPVLGGQAGSQECVTWTDVISKYNAYVSGQDVWTDVITCYNEYVSHQ